METDGHISYTTSMPFINLVLDVEDFRGYRDLDSEVHVVPSRVCELHVEAGNWDAFAGVIRYFRYIVHIRQQFFSLSLLAPPFLPFLAFFPPIYNPKLIVSF